MHVYLGGNARNQPRHVVHVCPAADKEGLDRQEAHGEWVSDVNEPLSFAVEFLYGKAEVPDHLGKYLVKRGIAQKTSLILPFSARKKAVAA